MRTSRTIRTHRLRKMLFHAMAIAVLLVSVLASLSLALAQSESDATGHKLFLPAIQGGSAQDVIASASGAAFTSVNEMIDGTGHCKNGNPNVNCNIYDGKEFVWMNGGPATAYAGAGDYFFAVLVPGGQANPNDGAPNNLSDGANGDYTTRTFHIDSTGQIIYSGSHDFDSNKIRLMPYDDTSNPGGVYILAICSLASPYPVDASSCKYDQFKIEAGDIHPGEALTIVKDANGTYDNSFSWDISKDVDQTEIKQSGSDATFSYTVEVSHDGGTVSNVKVKGTITVFNPNVDSNHNTVPVDIDGVTDQLSDGTSCTVSNGGLQTLTEAETRFAYECNLASLPQSDLNNTAAVSWSEQVLDNGNLLAASSANFIFKAIAFAENPIDNCVDVVDSSAGTLGLVCVGDANPTTFPYDRQVTSTPGTCTDFDNTATFTTNTTGSTGSASQTVTLCVGADLEVTKTAAPSFTRTYNWDISKAVDKTLIDTLGTTATFNYTVRAWQTSFTDSAWAVTGNIHVVNPNDWEAITADLSDAVDNGGSCTLDQTTVTVPASGSVDVGYSCTFSAGASGTNTATATWDSAAYYTPNGSASGTADYAFTTPTTKVNDTITVKDTFDGSTTTLGTLTATDAEPFASSKYDYSHIINVPANGCVSYTNTAVIAETGQSASQTVTACGPVKGGLTMGFWQNKNGQDIIKNSASTAGVCNVGTWLRQYAPFQDLSATATCTQVATYVTNVIKAANASGAAMNAMLKGQMLATALDVYFSQTAVGAPIKSYNGGYSNLGSVKVDLTKVCKNIAGGCTTLENVSSAFGGATSMTVADMLTYAATKSNSGGSAWYGQVKATQELAKDAFDAINNAKAFAAP